MPGSILRCLRQCLQQQPVVHLPHLHRLLRAIEVCVAGGCKMAFASLGTAWHLAWLDQHQSAYRCPRDSMWAWIFLTCMVWATSVG